ncbi:hypothetical protein MARPU_12040 [Marichromatium purpuratum 984]|uniref:HTH cro/C1-type domain-containing protein n=1 Tax=Marichromatium purpuratum 984 TaxID=765910 RepID=W0E931_MARPU|nr:helix-turn-helix domain-containing protein [Marichromatium purpuratum]AHF05571.1 hypothetical protein MARPU_12040 [Marichromatium purpuratum 984]
MKQDEDVFERQALKRLLKEKGLSIEQLAARVVDLDARTLQRLASGKTRCPHPSTVKKIADALGVEVSALYRPHRALSGQAEDADKATPFDHLSPAYGDRFVGRHEILRRLELALNEGRGVSLVGARSIGKSSILETWRSEASGLGHCVHLLSGYGVAGRDHQAFVEAILAETSSIGQVPESPDGAADCLSRWCDQRREATYRRPLILLDDAKPFLLRCDVRFLERLRGMLTDRRLCLVLASRQSIDAIYHEDQRTSPFLNLLELCRVGLLDEAGCQAAEIPPPAGRTVAVGAVEARQLIARGETRWREGDAEWLLEWAGGHPFYLMLLAGRLYEARGDGGGDARAEALARFRDEAERQLASWWEILGAGERERLRRGLDRPAPDFRLCSQGLMTADGRPFGRVLSAWLKETG